MNYSVILKNGLKDIKDAQGLFYNYFTIKEK